MQDRPRATSSSTPFDFHNPFDDLLGRKPHNNQARDVNTPNDLARLSTPSSFASGLQNNEPQPLAATEAASRLHSTSSFKDASTSGLRVSSLSEISTLTTLDLSALQPAGVTSLSPAKLEVTPIVKKEFSRAPIFRQGYSSTAQFEHPLIASLGPGIAAYVLKRGKIRILDVETAEQAVLRTPNRAPISGIWVVRFKDSEGLEPRWLVAAITGSESNGQEGLCFFLVTDTEEGFETDFLGELHAPVFQTFAWSTSSESQIAAAWVSTQHASEENESMYIKEFEQMMKTFARFESSKRAQDHALSHGIISHVQSSRDLIVAHAFSMDGSLYATMKAPRAFDPTYNAFELHFTGMRPLQDGATLSTRLAFPSLPSESVTPASRAFDRPAVSSLFLLSEPNVAMGLAENGNCPRTALIGFNRNSTIALVDFEKREWRHIWKFEAAGTGDNFNVVRFFDETATLLVANSLRQSVFTEQFTFRELPAANLAPTTLGSDLTEAAVFHHRLVDSGSTGLPWTVACPLNLSEHALPERCISLAISRENMSGLKLLTGSPVGLDIIYVSSSDHDAEPIESLTKEEPTEPNVQPPAVNEEPPVELEDALQELESMQENKRPEGQESAVPFEAQLSTVPANVHPPNDLQLPPAPDSQASANEPSNAKEASHAQVNSNDFIAKKKASPKKRSKARNNATEKAASSRASSTSRPLTGVGGASSLGGGHTPASLAQSMEEHDAADLQRALAEMEVSVGSVTNSDLRKLLQTIDTRLDSRFDQLSADLVGQAKSRESASPRPAPQLSGAALSAIANEVAHGLSGQMADIILPELHSVVREIVPGEIQNGVQQGVQEALPDELRHIFSSSPHMTHALTQAISEGVIAVVQRTAVDVVSRVLAPHFEETMLTLVDRIEKKMDGNFVDVRKNLIAEQSAALKASETKLQETNATLSAVLAKFAEVGDQNRSLERSLDQLTLQLSTRQSQGEAVAPRYNASTSSPEAQPFRQWSPIQRFQSQLSQGRPLPIASQGASSSAAGLPPPLHHHSAAFAERAGSATGGVVQQPVENVDDQLLSALSDSEPGRKLGPLLQKLESLGSPPAILLQSVSQPVLLTLLHHLASFMVSAASPIPTLDTLGGPSLPWTSSVVWAEAAVRLLQPKDESIAVAFKAVSNKIITNLTEAWIALSQHDHAAWHQGLGSRQGSLTTEWWTERRLEGQLIVPLRAAERV